MDESKFFDEFQNVLSAIKMFQALMIMSNGPENCQEKKSSELIDARSLHKTWRNNVWHI